MNERPTAIESAFLGLNALLLSYFLLLACALG